MVVDFTVLTIVVAVAEFDGQRLYHRKEHHLALLLVPHFCLSTCVCRDTAIPVVQRDKHWLGSYGNRDSGGKRWWRKTILIVSGTY